MIINFQEKGISGPICSKSKEIKAKGGPGKTGIKQPTRPNKMRSIPSIIKKTSMDIKSKQ